MLYKKYNLEKAEIENKGNYGNKDAAGYIKITEDEYNELNAIGGTT